MSKEILKQQINADITTNGLQQITGAKLNSVLNDIVDEMAIGGGIIEEGNPNAVSGGEVYDNFLISDNKNKGEIGYEFLKGEVLEMSNFNNPIDLVQGTVILNEKFENLETLAIKLHAITAGSIIIGSYKIENNIASRSKYLAVSLVVGENTISNFKVNEGEYFGFAYNMASSLGRVGALNESSYYSYFAEAANIGTGTTLSPPKNNQRLGIKIEAIKKESLVKDVENALIMDSLEINSLIDPSYIQNDVMVLGSGIVSGSYPTAKTLVRQPLTADTTYTFGGVATLAGKNLVITDINGTPRSGSVMSLTTQPRIFVTDDVYKYLNVCLRHPSEPDDSGWEKTAMLNVGTNLLDIGITAIEGLPLIDVNALRISDGVSKSSIKWDSENWLNPEWVIVDKFINNNGNLVTGAGWHVIKIDIQNWTNETSVRFGLFTGTSSGYIGFYDETDTKISFESRSMREIIYNVSFPANTRYIYLDLKDADDPVDKYANAIITKGSSTLTEFKPYAPYITEIDGKSVSTASGEGGEAYNQSLNTTDDVEFNSVTANEVEINGVIKNGTLAAPPVGLVSGEFWIDTTDSAINPILRRKS